MFVLVICVRMHVTATPISICEMVSSAVEEGQQRREGYPIKISQVWAKQTRKYGNVAFEIKSKLLLKTHVPRHELYFESHTRKQYVVVGAWSNNTSVVRKVTAFREKGREKKICVQKPNLLCMRRVGVDTRFVL